MASRRFRVYAWVALLLFGFTVCGLLWFRASLAETWLNRHLSDYGVSPAEVSIHNLGLWQSSFHHSQLGYEEFALQWDYLQLNYNPRRLWSAELDGLYADGLNLKYTYYPAPVFSPLPDPVRLDDPVVVIVPESPIVDWMLSEEDSVGPDSIAVDDSILPIPLILPPPVDPLALFYQVPFKTAQISRGSLALRNLDGDELALGFDVRMNPISKGSEWDLSMGRPGLHGQLNARVNSEQKRIRFMGNISLSERHGWTQVPEWIARTGGLADWYQWFAQDWDWQQARVQFLADWEAGQVAGISLELELDNPLWRHESGLATGDGGHVIATFSDAGSGAKIFAGISFPELHWQNLQIGMNYAELNGHWSRGWRLAWAPASLIYEQQALGDWVGQLSGDFLGQSFHLESHFQPRWESEPLMSLELRYVRPPEALSTLFVEVIDQRSESILHIEGEFSGYDIIRSKGSMRLNFDAEIWQQIGFPLNAGIDWITGEIRGLMNWDLSGFLPRGSGSVIVFDAAFSDTTGDWQAHGVNLNLPLRVLGFPQTTGHPRWTVEQLEFGELILRNLIMDFRMTTLDDFRVELLEGETAGGNWRFRPFKFDIRKPEFSTAVEFENIDGEMLQQWLPEGRYKLQGKLEGAWPVSYRDGIIFAGHGIFRLEAESGGRLTFTDAEWLKETLAFAAGAPLELEDRLLEAMLSGISIKSLEIHVLDPSEPEAPLWMKVTGEARTDRLIVPVEGLVIRNRLQPEELLELLNMFKVPFLRPDVPQ